MKNVLKLLSILAVLQSCATMDIGSQTESNTDFSKYQTYAWLHRDKASAKGDPKINNDIIEGDIIEHTCSELNKRGLRVDTLNADLLFDYNIITKEKVKQVEEPVYSSYYNFPRRRYYYNPYNGATMWNYFPYYTGPTDYISGYRTVNVPYKEGTISIYAIDTKTNKMVWQGWAEGVVKNVSSFQKELPRNIKAIFKKFPKKVTRK